MQNFHCLLGADLLFMTENNLSIGNAQLFDLNEHFPGNFRKLLEQTILRALTSRRLCQVKENPQL